MMSACFAVPLKRREKLRVRYLSLIHIYALPDSGYKKYIRFFTGLILVLFLAAPVLQLFQTDVDRWMNDPEAVSYTHLIPSGGLLMYFVRNSSILGFIMLILL